MYVHTYWCFVDSIQVQCTGHCKSSPTSDSLKLFILMSVKILSERIRSLNSILAQLTVAVWKSSRLLCEFLPPSCLNHTLMPEIFASVPDLVEWQTVQPTSVRLVTDYKYTNTKKVEFCAVFLYLYGCVIWFLVGQWSARGGGGSVVQPPPEIPKARQKIVPNSTRLWKLFKKIAEFRMPTHQDVRKKGSKILKLRRFAFVLH